MIHQFVALFDTPSITRKSQFKNTKQQDTNFKWIILPLKRSKTPEIIQVQKFVYGKFHNDFNT